MREGYLRKPHGSDMFQFNADVKAENRLTRVETVGKLDNRLMNVSIIKRVPLAVSGN